MSETIHRPPRPFRVSAVLFDFDGTLTRPGAIDWDALRTRLGCRPKDAVLEFIESLPDAGRRAEAAAVLEAFEAQGADRSKPAAGAASVASRLRSRKCPVGILTRNSRRSVERALDNFDGIRSSDFDMILTRETPIPPKPDPAGVHLFAESVRVPVAEVVVVGDYYLDVEAGRRAGAITVLIDHGAAGGGHAEADFRIFSLDELEDVLRLGRPIAGGKLPNDLLERFLDASPSEDPSLLIRPGIGQDTAAVDIAGDNVLILKSDPITFVTDEIARYAVLINANDIVTSGAIPRWFLSTLLFPPGSTPSQIQNVMVGLQDACQREGISLCGGHTEITDAVVRPVVIGMLAGTVEKDRLIDKANMAPNDAILMTKKVAVEGTAIIAREFSEKLSALGLPAALIETAAGFLSEISILPEARIAAGHPGVSAMHDVTEGGLATALEELSLSGNHRIRILVDRIPVFPETETICRGLDIDPLGLIGSGSLLICCREATSTDLIRSIRDAGIEVTPVGKVLEPGRGIDAVRNGEPVGWPAFGTDELTRLF